MSILGQIAGTPGKRNVTGSGEKCACYLEEK